MKIHIARLVLLAALVAFGGTAVAGTTVVFSKDEISIIQDYYSKHPVDTGPSNGKKSKSKPLPPGIAKNLARGKPLPPGIAKQQLPSDLVRLLPPVRPGYERIYVDGRVLLVDIATQVIHDVLMEAVYH